MAVLSDNIEEFILSLISGDDDTDVLVQRNELATYFKCAPSHINYVLTTRFTPERGFNVESKRGGGGYIRIIRMQFDSSSFLKELLESSSLDFLNEETANKYLERLFAEKTITEAEYKLAKTAVSDKAIIVPSPIKEKVRGSIFRQMAIHWLTAKQG